MNELMNVVSEDVEGGSSNTAMQGIGTTKSERRIYRFDFDLVLRFTNLRIIRQACSSRNTIEQHCPLFAVVSAQHAWRC